MACYATGSAEGDAELCRQETQEELTKVTRMLCDVCSRLEAAENADPWKEILQVTGLAKWWNNHKQIDKARRSREKKEREKADLLARAMSKLTEEELEAIKGMR